MMTLPEAEAVARRFVTAGFAARTYPSDRETGGHMVTVTFGRARYRVYDTDDYGTAVQDFMRGVFSNLEGGEGVNATEGNL